MDHKLNVSLAIAAGLLGGLLSRYIAPASVHAQAPPPTPNEIRAQRFTLVNLEDQAIGTFMVEPMRRSPGITIFQGNNIPTRIVLRDSAGRELWSAQVPLR
jgi:hypothetical protein